MDKPVIIFGANTVGKAALDIFNSHGIIVYCFLDDNKELHGTEIDSIAVMGKTNDAGYLKLIGQKCEAFVASDENSVRESTVDMLNKKRKVMPVNAIHSKAVLSENANIGHGNFINAGVKFGTGTQVGSHNLFNTGCILETGSKVGDFVQIGPGSIIGSDVTIEDNAFIGAGVNIVSGLTIGKGARIGVGSVVIDHVKEGETVFGNPAVKVNK